MKKLSFFALSMFISVTICAFFAGNAMSQESERLEVTEGPYVWMWLIWSVRVPTQISPPMLESFIASQKLQAQRVPVKLPMSGIMVTRNERG